ncbi:MAG: DcrB-related protein [Myxococcales bacterium]|nr:DcrB-related protein [Myxococcales bacterium]
MATYFVNEASFQLPDAEFIDKTVNVLETRTASGGELGIVMSRTRMPREKTLRQMVDEHIAEEKRALRAYAVLFEREIQVANVPAIEVGVRWRIDSGMVYHRHVHVAVWDTYLLVSTNTALQEQAICDMVMDQVLQTFRFIEPK